jgi:hypothetical protein
MAPQPFVPLLDGAQVEVKFLLFGEVVENVLWFWSRFGPPDSGQIQALAEGVAAWHIANVMPLLSHEINLYDVVATDWSAFPTPFQYSAVQNTDGGSSSASLSANVAIRALFKGTSDQTFRSGSNFVPGIPRDAVAGNYYTNTIKDALFEAYVALIDETSFFEATHTWRWVITSRIADRAYRSEREQSRVDFVRFPSPVVSPRRKRLP